MLSLNISHCVRRKKRDIGSVDYSCNDGFVKNPNSPFCYKPFFDGSTEEVCVDDDLELVRFYSDNEITGFITLISSGKIIFFAFFQPLK